MNAPRYNDDGTYTPEYWEAKAAEADQIAENMQNKSAKATMRVVAESYRLLEREARARQCPASHPDGDRPRS